ncbi:PRC-barrel domain-containing protein [Achromobacter insolitus]|uniref:PRC-barrel domain-containing protein n=1 Tax=Achromobacter insolitus TaxID=217204 RepID=UPI000AAA8657|nr:PRC-barrel domain-containing protein [Achromobacter insolitus]AVG40529.1 photosystem reaction center subunit H [Achromobacter insolitus]
MKPESANQPRLLKVHGVGLDPTNGSGPGRPAPCSAACNTNAPRKAAKREKTATLGLAVLLGVFSNVPAVLAQGAPQSVTEVRIDVAKVDAGYRASKMSGSAVYNGKKEKIGTVDDLILGPPDWVPYAVLSVGGWLGMGNHLVTVPLSKMQVAGDQFVLPDATKDTLKALPEFKYKK